MKKKLETVTLVAVSSIKINATIKALQQSMKSFDFFEVLFISDKQPLFLPKGITYKKCDKITSIDEYSYFMLYTLVDYIQTSHILVIQHDGFILNPDKWTDDFLKYDYIGAPWPDNLLNSKGEPRRVGNGGFSLRSKKLIGIPKKINMPFVPKSCNTLNEDVFIAVNYHEVFEKNGCIFAPIEIAARFSQEIYLPEFDNIISFGFHAFYPKKWLTAKQTKIIYKNQYTKKERILRTYKKFKRIIKKLIKNYLFFFRRTQIQ